MSTPEICAACLLPFVEREDVPPAPTRICVIDLGTNSFHAVVVDAYPNGTFEVVDRRKEMVRLGEKGLKVHRLTEAALTRGFEALRRIQLLARGWQARETLAYATSALREAENGGAFIERVRRELGLIIRPISGSLEAQLIYRGVRLAVALPAPTLLVDVGGGSTEFIVATSEEVYFATSLKLGAARMTEQFVSTDPITPDEADRLRTHCRELLAPVYEAARAHGVQALVGSSGTVQSLAMVSAIRAGEGRRSIFEQSFTADALRDTARRVIASSRAEREATPGIDGRRVPQIVAGAVLVDTLLIDLPLEDLRVSPYALREGMVVHFMEQNHPRIQHLAPYADVRRRSIYELGFRCQWEQEHARHVATLALQLFDGCRSLHDGTPQARELLEYAALLHDIGYHISRTGHHRHTRYLICHADLHGFRSEEVETMAYAARYHRGALPNEDHQQFMRLDDAHRRRIVELAALLRLAEGLDRSHYQNVVAMRTALTEERLTLTIETKGDPELELWGARQGRDLFEKTFTRRVVVEAGRVSGDR